ncbi:uncharacterized protein LOC114928435 [Nylanderia fulva]|uniref:uncharacterized protein LOC114928435 n=1 Tax=Nylanderia fulva TaxID=613905 RepID=UPI0010FBA5EC|nr:uncharacterized protein LOC114928435 [Nylanderia fulva]
MRRFAIVMLGLISLVSAKPALLSVPLTYATSLTSGTQIGTSRGQILDQLKVSTAHLDERGTNSAETSVGEQDSSRFDSAPLGVDGRVVDTPEVAAARAAHVAAHVNEKINLVNEAARSSGALDSSGTSDLILAETVMDPDGRVLSAPEATATKGNQKSNLGTLARLVDGSVVPLVLVPETVVQTHDDRQNPANARSLDALAVAGPVFAYGRLIY